VDTVPRQVAATVRRQVTATVRRQAAALAEHPQAAIAEVLEVDRTRRGAVTLAAEAPIAGAAADIIDNTYDHKEPRHMSSSQVEPAVRTSPFFGHPKALLPQDTEYFCIRLPLDKNRSRG